jgi:GTP-binding protein Era
VRSGFCSLVGRPNVGKSTLLNRILGTKVSIVSDKPQTTRRAVRGVLDRPGQDGHDGFQVVFVDTPGIHKPRTLLGERLNDTAFDSLHDVDVVVLVIDATAPLGRGDRFVAERVPPDALMAVNKVDRESWTWPPISRCRPSPATAWTPWWTPSWSASPKGPATTRKAW